MSRWHCAARTASPSCVALRGSARVFTAGRRSSSRPARSGFQDTARLKASSGEVEDLRREDGITSPRRLHDTRCWRTGCLKRSMIGDGGDGGEVKRPTPRLIWRSPPGRTLPPAGPAHPGKLGIPADLHSTGYVRSLFQGLRRSQALEDRTGGPGRIWNRIPDDVRRHDRGPGPSMSRVIDLPVNCGDVMTDTGATSVSDSVRLPPAQGPRPDQLSPAFVDHRPGSR